MRIAYVLTSVGMGGAERQALTLAARMAGRGHGVHVVVLRRLPAEWHTALPVSHLDMRKTPASAAAGLMRARQLLRELRPDIVHSHSVHANLFARALRVLAAGPALVSTVHNVYEGGRLRMLAYRWTDGLSDCTTVVSKAAAGRFLRLKAVSPQRCRAVANAIEMAEFAPDAVRRAAARAAMGAGEDFVWLAAGRIVPAKDYPNLLRAFARARATVRRMRLWVAGEGHAGAEEALQRLAAELEIADCVRWLGLRRDVPALLDAADGFVSSSAWEGMPLAVAEAMAMGKPVVGTEAGGVGELVGQAGWPAPERAGWVVPVRDAEALSAAMLGLVRAPAATRQAMGCAARERILTHFNMETRAAEWEQIYRSVLDPGT